jgi:hypothetical protein
MRWMDRFGWRPMTELERVASANYYRELGRHMNIKDAPASYREFAAHLDATSASTWPTPPQHARAARSAAA